MVLYFPLAPPKKKKLRKVKHGMSNSSEYAIWRGMLARCFNKKSKNYEYYGGRGIAVCNRWLVFANFLEDVGRRPSKKHSLDRINNNRDYGPENCRWATYGEQANNRRNCKYIKAYGRKRSIAQWSNDTMIDRKTITDRIYKHGWTAEDALSIPTENNSRLLYAFGQTRTLANWSRMTGIKTTIILNRLRNNWVPEDALKIKWGKI